MQRILLGLAVVAGAAMLPSQAQASDHHGHHGHHGHHSHHAHHHHHHHHGHYHRGWRRFGDHYSYGYRFNYRLRCWNRSWSARYGCNVWWCPRTRVYYYYCAPQACYLPVTYCPTGVYAYSDAGPVAPDADDADYPDDDDVAG